MGTTKELEKDFPGLKKFWSRLQTLEELKKVAREETDPAYIADGYEVVINMQERLYSEIIAWHSQESTRQFNSIHETLMKVHEQNQELVREQQEYHDKMCLSLISDPRGTFENVILKAVERKIKAESGDGWNNWQWGLHFPLITRLRMAWKLIFG